MRAGIRPGEFWNLSPAEYNLIVEGYKEQQKENLYRDLRNAYYTGCFAQVEKPKELYDKIIDTIDSKLQTGEEIFSFLKTMATGSESVRGDVMDSHFKIPLKLTPEFNVGIFSYIHQMEEDSLELYLPDVSLSLNNEVLKPAHGVYSIKPGLVKVNYNEQVYTIVMIKSLVG